MKNINRKMVIVFLIWLLLAIFTVFIYYTGNTELKWIDIPTHIAAGILIAATIFKIKTSDSKKALTLAFLPFLGWEFFEIGASTISQNEFIIELFKETPPNRLQDLVMNTVGFLIFLIATNKKF